MPPLVNCPDCGDQFRTWSKNPLCSRCIQALKAARPTESLREFRARIPSLADVFERAKKDSS